MKLACKGESQWFIYLWQDCMKQQPRSQLASANEIRIQLITQYVSHNVFRLQTIINFVLSIYYSEQGLGSTPKYGYLVSMALKMAEIKTYSLNEQLWAYPFTLERIRRTRIGVFCSRTQDTFCSRIWNPDLEYNRVSATR